MVTHFITANNLHILPQKHMLFLAHLPYPFMRNIRASSGKKCNINSYKVLLFDLYQKADSVYSSLLVIFDFAAY